MKQLHLEGQDLLRGVSLQMVYGKSSSVELVVLRGWLTIKAKGAPGPRLGSRSPKVQSHGFFPRDPDFLVFPANRNSAGATAVWSRLSVHSSPPRIMGGPNMFKVSAKNK